jgi:hypothetical protein
MTLRKRSENWWNRKVEANWKFAHEIEYYFWIEFSCSNSRSWKSFLKRVHRERSKREDRSHEIFRILDAVL